ncbi:MAG: helix-turn-helix domain-containing protein [Winogradskyella sp.]|uniref:tetratricopeptide repeat protein n=1 Tax=Winogradskyella sp. TaxID=1883156 RepID=UPI0025FD72A7|nr:tetratricopeptide repeat protein [Winogradskyella sp.]NRB60424.1 helix-turn-helix domain-containing protein [Winogradskyella sp.]
MNLTDNFSDIDKSIVVLPFKNMSGDNSYDYFSDGITEEIINALSKVEGLKVTARTSSFAFKNKPTDIRIIGNELGVTNAVEGSIRIAKDRIRISTQLTRTDNGFLLWSEKFDRQLDDVFALQDEISLLIADKIRENFGHIEIEDSLSTIHTQNLKAYQWYLKGRHYQLTWNLVNMERAIEFYKKSANIDSNYADPLVAIGWCYGIIASWRHIDRDEGLKKANEYLTKGYKLDPNSYMGHFSKATISFWGNWQFKKGYQELKKCLEVNPFYGDANEALAELYTANGLFDEALKETDHILKINPLSPNHYYTRGNIFYLQGDFDMAIKCFESSLKIDTTFDLSRHLKLACLIFKKNKKDAITFARTFLSDKFLAIIEELYNAINNNQTAEYNELLLTDGENLMVFWDLYYLVYCNKVEEALNRLEVLVEDRIGQVINFQFDPFLEPLRETNRYKKLVEGVSASEEIKNLIVPQSTYTSVLTFSDADSSKLKAQLDKVLSKSKLYLNPEISLRVLAKELDINPNKLSKFINDNLKTNFNELINTHRLVHFKQISLKPENKHLTLLGLAYDSGFNSKTVFNTYFKKVEGITPKQWLKLQL